MNEIRSLPTDDITENASLQVRAIDLDLVDRYQKLMKEQAFDPIHVFHIDGEYVVADGWHRLAAARELKRTELQCCVHRGNLRDARLFAAGANAHHGQPLRRDEKRRAVYLLLADNGVSTGLTTESASIAG